MNEVLDISLLQQKLSTRWLGRSIVYMHETTSTNDVAKKLAHDGVSEGTIVLTEHQIAGRGRMGRKWFSPPGVGIYMSVVLRPKLPPQKVPQLTMMAAVATCEGLQYATELPIKLKWPNDIMIHNRKVGGILVEGQACADMLAFAVLGVGINVNTPREAFPPDIRELASSLAIEAGRKFSRVDVLIALLTTLEDWYEMLRDGKLDLIRERFADLHVARGHLVVVQAGVQHWQGYVEGITPEGALVLKQLDGEYAIIPTGVVRIVD